MLNFYHYFIEKSTPYIKANNFLLKQDQSDQCLKAILLSYLYKQKS